MELWSQKDIDFLKEFYPLKAFSASSLTEALGRSTDAIHAKAKQLGLKKETQKFTWTDDKIETLKKEYPFKSAEKVAVILGCSTRTAWNKAFDLQIKKDRSYYIEAGKRLEKAGEPHRIQKGYVPKSKGKKVEEWMTDEQLTNFEKRKFKKGQTPHNALEDFEIRKHNSKSRNQQYLFIKLPNKNKMVLYHKYLWELNNGKVPKGKCLIFKDGNTENCDLSNIECITIEENMKRNSIHNYPMEIKDLIRTNARLTNKLKEYEK